jgi:NAD(P)-dependent dehydrogenase (short-subunit alcohol dehydrogenase family)
VIATFIAPSGEGACLSWRLRLPVWIVVPPPEYSGRGRNGSARPHEHGHAEAVKTLIPLARMADVSEIAGFVSYLASDETGFITGASLTIDGGYVA